MHTYLCQGLGGPCAEPIDDASVEQGGRRSTAACKAVARRIHGEDNVETSLDLRGKTYEHENNITDEHERRWVTETWLGGSTCRHTEQLNDQKMCTPPCCEPYRCQKMSAASFREVETTLLGSMFRQALQKSTREPKQAPRSAPYATRRKTKDLCMMREASLVERCRSCT